MEGTTPMLSVDDITGQQIGHIMYSLDMPVMVLTDVCTSMGLVNGAIGTAVGIIPDSSGIIHVTYKLLQRTYN